MPGKTPSAAKADGRRTIAGLRRQRVQPTAVPTTPRPSSLPRGRAAGPRRRLAWPAGLLALAGLLGWIARDPAPPEAARVAVVATRPAAVPAATAPAAIRTTVPARDVAIAPVRAAPAATTRPPLLPEAGDGTEVCGWGRVQLPADDPFPLQRLPAATRRAALDQAQARMAADADVRVRAAGLLLAARSATTSARERIEQLARLAAATADATAYALALQGCRSLADPAAGACGLLGPAQAAQLEPANAWPWLALAAEAAARQDGEAEHDAMRHAAQATHATAHTPLLPLLVARALPAPDGALPRTLALGVALGLQDVARLLPPPGGVAQARAYCLAGPQDAGGHAAGMPDEDARATPCRGLAQLLLQRGSGVAELGAGLDIARRWSPALDGLAAWQQEHDALVDTAPPLPDGIDLGCAAQQRQLDWLQRVAALGERAALREQLAASGHSIAEWSARHHRSLRLAQATVASLAADTADRPDDAEPPTR